MRPDLLRDPHDGGKLLNIGPPTPDLRAGQQTGEPVIPIGVTETVLWSTAGHAYPVVEGIPILLRPERLSREPAAPCPIAGSHFAEAYQERRLYGNLAETTAGAAARRTLSDIYAGADPAHFPHPVLDWMEPGTTAGAYRQALEHIGPVTGRTVLQLGGIGSHALKLVHAGADHAIVVSPVVAELVTGAALARELGVDDRVTFVGGVAEELPVDDGAVSVVYAGSTIHHTVTDLAFPEIRRILQPGGRFASVDVWKGLLHGAGTRLFGKCGGNPFCRPLDHDRLGPVRSAFPDTQISFHGALFRYPVALLARVGLECPPALGLRLAAIEDNLPLGPLTERVASLVCIRATA